MISRNQNCEEPQFVQVLDNFTCTFNSICTGDGHTWAQRDQCSCEGNVCDPPGSTTCEASYRWVYQTSGCGIGDTDTPNDPHNLPTGGGGGDNTGTTETELLEETPLQRIVRCYDQTNSIDSTNPELSDDLISALEINPQCVFSLDDFLEGNCDIDAQLFGLEAATVCINDFEVDYDEKIINKLTNECAKNIFSQLEDGIYESNTLKP